MANQIFSSNNIQATLTELANNNLLPIVNVGAPTNGVTGAGFAGKGCLLVNVSAGTWFTNTGTMAAPTWTAL